MDREIWFEKILWGYMPCHWKGWAFVIGICVLVVPILFVIDKMSVLNGGGVLDALFVLVLGATLLAAWTVARRHSK